MFKTYIPKKLLYLIGLILFILFWFLEFHIFVLCLTIVGIGVFLFKKNEPMIPMTLHSAEANQLYAPVNGLVKSIRTGVHQVLVGDDLIEIRLTIPYFAEMGLYLPMSSEIAEIRRDSEGAYFRYSENESLENEMVGRETAYHYSGFTLKLKKNQRPASDLIWGLKIVRCLLGLAPDIWVLAGDKGECGANFGFLPLGGSVFLYLPASTKLLIKEGEQIFAGQTVVAKIPA